MTEASGAIGDGDEPPGTSFIDRARGTVAAAILYPLLALLTFPTLGLLIAGQAAPAYSHDLFDIARSGVGADWFAHGPTLWNVHVAGGNAALAQQAIGPYALDVPMALAVGPFGAFVIGSWLLPAFAGIAMHLFLRDVLRLSTFAVLAGSILYVFAFWHPIIGFVPPAIPLLLWLLERAARPGPRRWRFLAARILAGAFVLYNGQSQIVVIVAAVELAWLIGVHAGHGPTIRRLFATWAGSWLLAFALYGPVLLTQVVALPDSHRAVWQLSSFLAADPFLEALRRYSPVLLGVPMGGGWGSSATVYGTWFVGSLALPLVALAIVHGSRDRRQRFLLALLVAIPVIDLVATIATPLQEQVPVLKSFQVVRVRHLLPFVLAAIAAIGFDRLRAGMTPGVAWLPVAPWRRIVLGLSILPVLGVVVRAAGQVGARRGALVDLDLAAIGWLVAFGALLAGLAGIALIAFRIHRPAIPAGALLVALLLLLVVERSGYAHAERLTGSDISTWQDDLGVTPGQAFLLAQPDSAVSRVLTFGEDANRMGAVGLLQADGYQVMYPAPYHELFGRLIAPQLALDPERWIYFHHWGNRAITFGPHVDPELLALAGVRWLYVRGPDVPTVPGIVARFREGDVTVYETPAVVPRVFVATGVEVLPDDRAVGDRLAAASIDDLTRTAVLADGPDARSTLDAVGPAVAGSGVRDTQTGSTPAASIASYTPDRVVIDVATGQAGVLVLTDVWAPGWIAEVDGVPRSIVRADLAFRGVVVLPGDRRVILRYAPTATYIGFVVAIGALAVLFALVVVVRRHDRRGDSSD